MLPLRQFGFAAVIALLGVGFGCRKEAPQVEASDAQAIAIAPSASVAQAPGSVASSAAPSPSAKAPAELRLNVLLIMIDSLRADMPWTGYPREIAPRLSQFAKEWVLYPRAYSLSSYTAKSVLPALVGKYPGELSRDALFFTKWGEDNELVTERLQKLGYKTLTGQGHGYFLPQFGMNQGWNDYRLLPGTFLDTTGVKDITSERLNKLAKEMLSKPENVKQDDGQRFFAYFHFLDPHYTYNKHPDSPDFGNKRRDLYDNEVHFTDKWVGDLIDWVDAQPFGKDTAIFITADHGEGFGERGRYRHAYDVWESLVRVPLFVRVPGAAPRRIEEPRGHIDLVPTIAELTGIRDATGLRGKSLVPELFGAPAEARPVLVDLPRADLMDRKRAFIDGKYKLIAFGDNVSYELFDVTTDLEEKQDLSKEQPELFATIKQKYLDFIAPIPNTPVTGGGKLLNAPPGQRF
ncbi:MAG: sulfatase [Myxococcota bacterium]|nr:sulfatase [Myxococcota bacterium]